MSSPRNPISRLLLLPTLVLASSCAEQATIAPPVTDLQAVVEQKPQPTDDIATSQQAYDQYQASLEAWGDRLHSAGGRLCRWSERVYKIRVGCPK